MDKSRLKTYAQKDPYSSSRGVSVGLRQMVFEFCWSLFCQWTPKPLNFWRLFFLSLFGAKLNGKPFVHQRARIDNPWNLVMHDRACLGDRAHAYCLATIVLEEAVTIAQEAYLCTGTHDFADQSLPLQVGEIVIGRNAFVGARAFVLPTVRVGENAVIGACAIVTKDVEPYAVVAGNPAKVVGSLLAGKGKL